MMLFNDLVSHRVETLRTGRVAERSSLVDIDKYLEKGNTESYDHRQIRAPYSLARMSELYLCECNAKGH